jgi:hypothetical protein
MGRESNSRYRAVRRFARRNSVTFVLPERVAEELSVDAPSTRQLPVETAIEEGWATVAEPLDFTQSVVSRTMDGVQRYIANADDRPADEVERADAALAALAAQRLSGEETTEVYIYTTDIAAGDGAETVLASEGYGDSVTFVDGFRFIEEL